MKYPFHREKLTKFNNKCRPSYTFSTLIVEKIQNKFIYS